MTRQINIHTTSGVIIKIRLTLSTLKCSTNIYCRGQLLGGNPTEGHWWRFMRL
jgi:hypothetical protein